MSERSARRVALHHDPGHRIHAVPGHPERPERIGAILAALEADGLLPRLSSLPPRVATDDELRLVHTQRLIDQLRSYDAAGGAHLDADTAVLSGSVEAAARAVGGALAAVDAILGGGVDAAFCLDRPPGHHATADIAMGFCLFNQAAVATRYAQATHGLGRVAVIDFDVHHGNGTQAIFERDASVLYLSTHEYPFYPGTGHWKETGAGNLINLSLPSGCGDVEYAACFDRVIVPAVRRFRPELIVVSAGFDAHLADPLADMAVTEAGYGYFASQIAMLSDELCAGRMLWILEGGYRLEAIARSASTALHALLGDTTPAIRDAPLRVDVARLVEAVATMLKLHRD